MQKLASLSLAIEYCRNHLWHKGKVVQPDKWQGIEAPTRMMEVRNLFFTAPMPNEKEELVNQVQPNLPWADVHFDERISGMPLNPGESYKIWPFYGRDDKMRNENKKFSHTYMERFWPKFAGEPEDYRIAGDEGYYQGKFAHNTGIRYDYGDLMDVVHLLRDFGNARQAFLPVWFPEDTGALHGGRVPCTIGYWFYLNEGKLDVTYLIRSCDFLRHFQDDIYLAVRLADYVTSELEADGTTATLGDFSMWIGSLHIFAAEANRISKPILK